MIRKDLGTRYELIAEEGKELVVIIDGEELGRAKTVAIPREGTLNEWVEVPEKKVEPIVEDEKAKRIAELEAELEALKRST